MTCVGRKTRAMERSECRPFSRVCEPSARQWLGVSPLLEQPLSLAPQTLRASDRRSGPYASLRSPARPCALRRTVQRCCGARFSLTLARASA